MNVLLINGSPHKKGCTYTALSEVAGQLEKNGIGSNIVHIGSKPIRGCIACGACRETGLSGAAQPGRCGQQRHRRYLRLCPGH